MRNCIWRPGSPGPIAVSPNVDPADLRIFRSARTYAAFAGPGSRPSSLPACGIVYASYSNTITLQ